MVAATAMAVAAGAAIVAAAYALYALLRDPLSPAGAAALTALAMALIAMLIGLLFLGRTKSKRHDDDHAGPVAGLQHRAIQLARAQPLIAAGAGLVGAYVLLRRPVLIALVASSLLGMKAQKTKDRRRGFF